MMKKIITIVVSIMIVITLSVSSYAYIFNPFGAPTASRVCESTGYSSTTISGNACFVCNGAGETKCFKPC